MKTLFACCLFLFLVPGIAKSLGVLAHEAVIDVLWESTLQPKLLEAYPNSTPEQLRKAKAYAYGGSILPDIGYFPFGSRQFSDLVHYVRSGDFVKNLFISSESLYQLAFALGVMTHYEADRLGHMDCTNKAVPMMFPKLKKKHGESVTFEQGCKPHGRLEFGFDVLQTAKGNYATTAYHDFIGFEVNDTVLDKAIQLTYGTNLDELFHSFSLAISVFRFAVCTVIPELTRDAWKIKNSFIVKHNPLATKESYVYKSDRKKYREEFDQPVLPSIVITVFIAVIPKVSTFSRFKPCMPDTVAEKLFETVFVDLIPANCHARCTRLFTERSAPPNVNLDTGHETIRGEYELMDKAYYRLLMNLQKEGFAGADPALKKDFIAFYNRGAAQTLSKRKERKIQRALADLVQTDSTLSEESRQ